VRVPVLPMWPSGLGSALAASLVAAILVDTAAFRPLLVSLPPILSSRMLTWPVSIERRLPRVFHDEHGGGGGSLPTIEKLNVAGTLRGLPVADTVWSMETMADHVRQPFRLAAEIRLDDNPLALRLAAGDGMSDLMPSRPHHSKAALGVGPNPLKPLDGAARRLDLSAAAQQPSFEGHRMNRDDLAKLGLRPLSPQKTAAAPRRTYIVLARFSDSVDESGVNSQIAVDARGVRYSMRF